MSADAPKAAPPPVRGATPATPPPGRPPRSRTAVIRRRVWTLGRLLLLFAALGLTYAAFFLTSMRVTTRAREVDVPDLKGKTVSEASALLARADLVLRVDQARQPDPSVPADRVSFQDPAPGSVLRRQRAVRVRLSAGQPAPVVPAVSGQTERAAELTLAGARIAIAARAEIRSRRFQPDLVVSQDPPPGGRAGSVTLLVNRDPGDQGFIVPDLVGVSFARAQQVLRQSSLRITLAGDLAQAGVPMGTIVQQAPQAGTLLPAREAISVWISR